MIIDYNILGHSQKFYSERGYKGIETPWTVTMAVSNITKPEDKKQEFFIPSKNKVLVSSGEQGFLYLYLKGFLPKGRYFTISPCFRDEVFDFLHTKYFMKTELIITDDVSKSGLEKIIDDAFEFFSLYLPKENLSIHKSPDSEGTDIFYTNDNDCYELGSYGIRSCEYLDWVYGTGIAEPRFSKIIELNKKNEKNI